jgi:NDP-sugar pyrophosphorylase family protein
MKAMILAAGFGTRFRPVTYTIPKVMVPLCGRPLIGWAIEALLATGIRDFIVNLHHLPAPIERYLRERYAAPSPLFFEVRFEFSYEPEILGTGGGLRKVRALLENDPEFFLVNGDTIQFPPYHALRATRNDALAALLLRHPPRGDRFTPVYHDDGIVTGFGKGTGEALMFSGAHLLSRRIFNDLPAKDFSGIVDEVYQPLIDSCRESIAGVVDDGLWFDIGTPQRYVDASRTLLDLTIQGKIAPARGMRVEGDSLIDDTATVRVPMMRSVAGQRSVIEGQLRDSVVWDDCRIASGVVLDSCIVAHGVEIAAPIALRNVLICRDDKAIPRDGEHRFEHGLILRDI